jgi:hypothetical protein
MHNNFEFVEIQQLFFFFSPVLLILHFVPIILFMSILDFLEAWDCDLNCDFIGLSSSFNLRFFIQGTFTMFKSEMIIIESVGWMPMKQLVV